LGSLDESYKHILLMITVNGIVVCYAIPENIHAHPKDVNGNFKGEGFQKYNF